MIVCFLPNTYSYRPRVHGLMSGRCFVFVFVFCAFEKTELSTTYCCLLLASIVLVPGELNES